MCERRLFCKRLLFWEKQLSGSVNEAAVEPQQQGNHAGPGGRRSTSSQRKKFSAKSERAAPTRLINKGFTTTKKMSFG